MNRPPILAECHVCEEPHTLQRMVHKWDYSYCLVCADKIKKVLTEFDDELNTTTEGTEQ